MPQAFVPLRIFSAFTMLEGAIDPKAIAKQARKLGFPAAAITDRNGLYGAMAYSEAAKKDGVQPIIGTMLAVARPPVEGRGQIIDWLALYAQDAQGYDNLCALVSAAHLDRPIEDAAHVPFDALEGRSDGLIALTAGGEGAVTRLLAGEQQGEAEAYLGRLERLFPGRLYLEIARRGDATEDAAEAALIDLAYARDLPLVATNPAFFAEAGFHAAHDTMLCIANSAYVDSDERIRSSADAWMKPADEMVRRFEDIPEAIQNTLVVAQRCAVAAPSRKPILPNLAGDPAAEVEALRRDAHAGLVMRLAGREEELETYRKRLDYELDIIVRMGFSGYFLIVADFIKWAKDHDIPVGPGRGSGAGSVVAWVLTITDLDPIALGLLFERFLNPERVSMPDFDIDFCETRRGEVISYVQQKYGRDHVAQIITFGRLKARAVLKDTGRVLQMSYGQVDRLAKAVPNHPTDPWTLDRALNGVAELAAEYKNDAEVKRLFDLAMKLEGLPRHSSTHAAGVVIGDRRLDKLVPLYRDPRSDMPVTQFDMKYVEGAGLVKFDFLGLKTLSVLKKAQQLLAKKGITADFDRLSWDDPEVYALLQKGDTVGVFQLESEGMRRTLAAVRPTNFGDIIALVSLYRPGPMDNIPMFGARKNGREPIEYPHPLLEDVLQETYGIFVYQEQVMQAAQVLAGYSLGEADLLRRAMGKKIKAEMDAQRERFVTGCADKAISRDKANELFDLIDKFAGYGFNKSHAAAYALVAYQTAWLKAHHKPEFYAASMCYDMALTDKLAIFVDDMRRMNVPCLPPCVNASEAEFSVEEVSVRYALGALKGVGERAMEQFVAERDANGRLVSLEQFAERIDPRLLNRRQLESLAQSGAFDEIEPNRAVAYGCVDQILGEASRLAGDKAQGQGGLFAASDGGGAHIKRPAVHWTLAESMTNEKDAFGFYFSAHPTDRYRHLAQANGVRSFGEIAAMPAPAEQAPRYIDGKRQPVPTMKMAALVEDVRWRTSARGNRYLLAMMSDQSGQFMASAFDDAPANDLEAAGRSGACMLLTVEIDRRPGEETPRVTVRSCQPMEGMGLNARLVLEVETADPEALPIIAGMVNGEGGGRGEIRLRAALADGSEAKLLLGRGFLLDAELVARIERLPGVTARLRPADAPKLALVS